jgi:hypothetical protein
MKKRIILLVFSLLLFTSGSIIANDGKNNSNETVEHDPYDLYEDHYAKDKNNVYYNGMKIKGAYAGSFIAFPDGYARDDSNIYYKGVKIEVSAIYAPTNKFEVLGNGYAKDHNYVYYKGKKIEAAKPDSFQILN